MPPIFVRWGPSHWIVLTVTVILPLVLSLPARRETNGRARRAIEIVLALILLTQGVAKLAWLSRTVVSRWADAMPLHLCDLALIATALACILRHQFLYEVAYFWGLAGTLQGLITPDLAYDFPSANFVFFFVEHGGIVAAILFLTVGSRMRPQWRSIPRAYLSLLVYGAVAGAFDAAFATNYGYLRGKPAVHSLLDWFGPWPWYIVTLAAVALLNFVILYLPWAIADRINAARRGVIPAPSPR